MHITVAICTWNRADLLYQTLQQLHKLRIPPQVEWDLVVVNNNCTDDTDQVISAHAGHLPLKRLFESTPGHTHARNCAIQAATGELIVWTDDDVLVDAGWLEGYAAAAARWPDASFFGGPIAPWFAAPPPDWIKQAWPLLSDSFAIRDFGNESFVCDDRHLPFGANFALRGDVQRSYPYDTRLGLKPGDAIRGDETCLLRQMMADGHHGRWVPESRVRHYVPLQRMDYQYVREFYRSMGRNMAIRWRQGQARSASEAPSWLTLRKWRAELRYQLRRRICGPRTWVEDLIIAERCRGRWEEFRRAKRAPTIQPNVQESAATGGTP